MAERRDLPKIKPDEAPSLLNANAGKWAFIGGVVTAPFGAAARAVGLAGGAALGGFLGKSEQENERREGRTVKEPSYWNKGILGGLALGAAVKTSAKLIGKPMGGGVSFLMGLGAAAVGSVLRYGSLKGDFDQATAQRDSEVNTLQNSVLALSQQLAVQQGYSNSVSPEEAARLAALQRTGGTPHFVDGLVGRGAAAVGRE